MKKLIALISSLAIVTTMSLTSFAAVTSGTTNDAGTITNAAGVYTATLPAASANGQTTIAVVEGDVITTSSIQYINQDAAKTSFDFALKDDFSNVTATKTLNVYMGGDKIAKTKVGSITFTYVADKYVITFNNEDGSLYETVEVAKDVVPAPVKGNPIKAEDATNTYTFAGWTPDIVKAVAAATYTAKFTAVPKQQGILGDVDKVGGITSTDAGLIMSHALGLSVLTNDVLTLADVDKVGGVTSTDAGLVMSAALGLSTLGQ